jgi:tricorn protease
VALRTDVRNPFGIRDDEPGAERKDSDKNAGDDKESDGTQGKGRRKERSKAPMKIDFEGIEGRSIRVPLEADNLTALEAGEENLLYQRSGPIYYGRESSSKAAVMAYSIKDREAKPVAEDVAEWSATADGKHVLARLSSKEIKYLDVGKSEDAKTVSLAGLVTTRNPAEEWRATFTYPTWANPEYVNSSSGGTRRSARKDWWSMSATMAGATFPSC